MPEHTLEPVTPDPKKLRRTALILVAIMILGGIVILRAYEKRTQEGEKDPRPSFEGQISEQKDLTFMRQDGKVMDLMSLKGKVLAVQCLPQSQPNEITTAVMKRLSKKFAGNENFALVTLMLDPGKPEETKAQLEALAGGLGAELPQWTVATNEMPTLHKFVKNEFKANMLPHQQDGKWLYDASLVLVDKNRHVRRAVVPQKRGGAAYVAAFDFALAKQWDEKGIKTQKSPDALSNTEQLELLLGDTITLLLAEDDKIPTQKGGATILYVGMGFVLLFALLVIKSRMSGKRLKP